MMELTIFAVTFFIAWLISLYVAYVKLQEYVENLKYDVVDGINRWLQTEDAAKLIYSVGALIGNGAKSGFGLQKGRGKMGLQDLIMGIAGSYLQQHGLVPSGEAETPQQTQTQGAVTLKSKY